MAARLTALLPRLLALTVIWLLGAATFTLAADKKTSPKAPVVPSTRPDVLTVPDVRGKPYVFAKGILQDAGFAWRVEGDVQGYAPNSVSAQVPAPGVRVIDNGSPTVKVRLVRNQSYGERGLPENEAPYPGTSVVLLSDWRKRHDTTTSESTTSTSTAATTTTATTTAATTTAATTTQEAPEEPEGRKPDFVVPGAKPEPADEMPLPERARRLEERIAAAGKLTSRLVNHWLYQHAWIVTGARFGWHDGAEALRILISVDEQLQRRWDFGARSERVARAALAYVKAKAS